VAQVLRRPWCRAGRGVREQREGRSVVSETQKVYTVGPPRVYSGPTRRDSRERSFWQQAGRRR
jgi:hypothetical protein